VAALPGGAARFAALVGLVRGLCRRAEVAPGEAIGPLASTSIGEPLTQLTLNTVRRPPLWSRPKPR
jgi:hypothetical protein